MSRGQSPWFGARGELPLSRAKRYAVEAVPDTSGSWAARGSCSSQGVCGSPSQQPSLKRQRGHCHVPCTNAIGVGQRQHSSVSVIAQQA